MAANIEGLIECRSSLVKELLGYLDRVARRTAELPKYYPKNRSFDELRQVVQVVEDRPELDDWLARQRELDRASGDDDRRAYKPRKGRADFGDDEPDPESKRADLWEEPPMPVPVVWDEAAGERFRRTVILGDPGFGKTWLLRWEARRLALKTAQQLAAREISLQDLVLPIHLRCSELNQSDCPSGPCAAGTCWRLRGAAAMGAGEVAQPKLCSASGRVGRGAAGGARSGKALVPVTRKKGVGAGHSKKRRWCRSLEKKGVGAGHSKKGVGRRGKRE
jgi:hypothetical protein